MVLAIVLVFCVCFLSSASSRRRWQSWLRASLTSGVYCSAHHTNHINISRSWEDMVIGSWQRMVFTARADQKFRDLGFSAEEAILQAGRRRLRPIVMTALATLAGMLPLSFAIGAGSQMCSRSRSP